MKQVKFSKNRKRFYATLDDFSIQYGNTSDYLLTSPKIKHINEIKRFEISPNEKYIALIGKCGEMCIYDRESLKSIFEFGGSENFQFSAMAFSPDSEYITAGLRNKPVFIHYHLRSEKSFPERRDVKEFKISYRKKILDLLIGQKVKRIKYSTDGRRIFILLKSGNLNIWDSSE